AVRAVLHRSSGPRLRVGNKREHRALRKVFLRHARARHLPAAVAVRGVVHLGGAHGQRHRPNDPRGPRGDEDARLKPRAPLREPLRERAVSRSFKKKACACSAVPAVERQRPASVSGGSNRTRSTVPAGRSTSLPSVAAIVPPAPVSTPARPPLAPARIPPTMAPAPAP